MVISRQDMSKNQEISTKKIEKASGKGEGPLEKNIDELVSPYWATDEGRRQQNAKIMQQDAAENAPKSEKGASKKKSSIAEDPRRYYDDSEYQKKIVDINSKISSTDDRAEKAKLQKEMDKIEEEVEEQQEEEKEQSMSSTTGGTIGTTQSTTFGGQTIGKK
jgi:hypothetical protein